MKPLKKHHQMFLQCMMCHHICDASEVKNLYRQCCSKYNVATDLKNNPSELAQFVITINETIRALNMEIRKGINEDNGSHFYVLVNSTEHPLSKFSSIFKENEMEYFKLILSSIIESSSGILSSNKVLNLSVKLEKRMTMMEAQDLLQRFIEEKWLDMANGKVWLSSRSIMELSSFIKKHYDEYVKDCHVCKSLVLRKLSCESCDLVMHSHCASRFFLNRKNKSCPECNAEWIHSLNKDSDSGSSS